MTTRRKSLSEILRGSGTDRDHLARVFDETEAAPDLKPLPAGEYLCHLASADLFNARTKGTPGVKLAFRVLEPAEHAGRFLWDDLWLTPAALPQTKRDLGKLGIVRLEQLETAVPPDRIRCKVKAALRTDDDGVVFNRVRSFEVLGIDTPTADPFAPGSGDAAEPAGPVDTSFDPATLDTDKLAGGAT